MHLIKLDAIDSTNTFLKDLCRKSMLENFTVVVTKQQFSGRGQMGAKWLSEPGKNLMFSVFVRFDDFLFSNIAYLNYTVSLAVFKVLKELKVPNLSLKWPNDIMSANCKIGGILIENSIHKGNVSHSIIGIGLNVNQEFFLEELKLVSSLKKCLGKEMDLNDLLNKLMDSLENEISHCQTRNFTSIKENYLGVFYKKNIPTMFEDSSGAIFIGKIVDVLDIGKIQIELDNETITSYGLKEVKMLR